MGIGMFLANFAGIVVVTTVIGFIYRELFPQWNSKLTDKILDDCVREQGMARKRLDALGVGTDEFEVALMDSGKQMRQERFANRFADMMGSLWAGWGG